MLTKKITPIITGKGVVGTTVDYRLFGILLYRKTLLTPANWGYYEYEFQTCI